MLWSLEEALQHYQNLGAPRDQGAIISLLKEIQTEMGCVPQWAITRAAEYYGIAPSLILALIRRVPRVRLENSHLLEICGGPNCPRKKDLMTLVEKRYGKNPREFTLRQVGCMRQCGKGPNIRWDGKIFNGADEDLIRSLVEKAQEKA
jgi:NADH:ubiquinone oxidoreductase subunit E